MTFTWQNGRQLATLQKGTDSITYEYNESGIRTKKTVNGIETVYYLDDSGKIIKEQTGNSALWYYYNPYGEIEAVSLDGERSVTRRMCREM